MFQTATVTKRVPLRIPKVNPPSRPQPTALSCRKASLTIRTPTGREGPTPGRHDRQQVSVRRPPSYSTIHHYAGETHVPSAAAHDTNS